MIASGLAIMKLLCRSLLDGLLTTALLLLAAPTQGQLSVRTLHSFMGGTDGQQPYVGLVQGNDGALYGTTFMGGKNGAGVIFRVNPDGSSNTVLYDFPANGIDPFGLANPSGVVQGADGALYGTTGFGGASGNGTVFKINPDGTGFAVLYSFDPSFGGAYEPTAGLIQGRDGKLYGTTQYGGAARSGCVFSVSTNGSGFITLHQFGMLADGAGPQAPLIQGLDGALYGTTPFGGSNGMGTIYRLTAEGTETVVHNFSGSDGNNPFTAGLVQGPDGTLYGTTQQGGSGDSGTVFKLNPDGAGFAVLHDFGASPTDGHYPGSALVLGNDGALYGTTAQGGPSNSGVVFRLRTDGSEYEVLHAFGAHPTDGRNPAAPLVRANDGGLFGTTGLGGDNDLGTVFRLAPAPPVISSILQLPDGTMRLTVNAAPKFSFRIEASSDHRQWVTLTNLPNESGSVQFVDSAASNAPSRFYRAAWVP